MALNSLSPGVKPIKCKKDTCKVSDVALTTECRSVVDDPNTLVEDSRGYVDHPLAQTNYISDDTRDRQDVKSSQQDKTIQTPETLWT